MNLRPRNSLPGFESFFNDRLPTFRMLPDAENEVSHLAVDIKENDDNFEVKADFPGIKKEDISVIVDDNVLTISAEHKEESEETAKGKLIRKERRYGKVSRSFNLGQDLDENAVIAKFDNGVLTLSIPKATEQEQVSKKIPVS